MEKFRLCILFVLLAGGSWSMAEVMAMAIFMAYIGFTGIITEQLKHIEKITPTLDLLTTNNSNLRTGFILKEGIGAFPWVRNSRLQSKFKGKFKACPGEPVRGRAVHIASAL